MEGYKTWKYLVINFYPTEDFPRLFFCRRLVPFGS